MIQLPRSLDRFLTLTGCKNALLIQILILEAPFLYVHVVQNIRIKLSDLDGRTIGKRRESDCAGLVMPCICDITTRHASGALSSICVF
ncbi:hypothetical protein KCV07_g107, partial [Aureobasidium melanogenum]